MILPALLAPGAVLLARAAGSPILLPVLATLTVYPMLAALLVRGRRRSAAVAALLWAASLSASIVACAIRDPGGTGAVVLHGTAYRDEMFAFIRSGSGTESDPRRFLPQHLLHLVVFCILAACSAGLLGIALGAILVGYMSYYVGCLAASGGAPAIALCLGWPPWAILRVVAFVLLGIALSDPLLMAVRRRFRGSSGPPPGLTAVEPHPPPARRPWRAWYMAAALLLAADAGLKFTLAPTWADLLRPCLGP
ncbi:MAG: hypothetical protein AUI47_05110 [Acidobacteria bacterium 13_1_40CM_2_68_5]|nr:MAG: hypothetical protein AUI47_05110 [Acidobacteria bacterium 13_1_40CM_2_68_5]